MATFPQTADAASVEIVSIGAQHRRNAALWCIELWHLLSLDAPSVAMLWTWFLAKTNHVAVPASSVLAMGIAVWTLYAADRLLDSRAVHPKSIALLAAVNKPWAAVPGGAHNPCVSSRELVSQSADLEPRHHFHRRHQKAFRTGIAAASVGLAILMPRLAPRSVHLYLFLGTLLFAYFILIHTDIASTRRLPKELAVGLFFSAATFVPTIARAPGIRLALLPGAGLFALLCSLNCLLIYRWEHPAPSPDTHPATRIALGVLPNMAACLAIAGVSLSLGDHALPWRISIACASSALLLLLLHVNRLRLEPTTLRAAADICLLTPILLLYSWR